MYHLVPNDATKPVYVTSYALRHTFSSEKDERKLLATEVSHDSLGYRNYLV